MVSRYKAKRRTPITIEELGELIAHVRQTSIGVRLDQTLKTSLIAVLYYSGLRVAEVVGDSKRKWKTLTQYGKQMANSSEGLGRDWMNTEEGFLWEWRYRGRLPGIIKEDIKKEGQLLYIESPALKHGIREDPLELSLTWPYVNIIREQWNDTPKEMRVWPICQTSARTIVMEASEHLYPHAFRGSLASNMARDPTISVSDMMGWFGWARAATADNYIMAQRSKVKARESIDRMVKKNDTN